MKQMQSGSSVVLSQPSSPPTVEGSIEDLSAKLLAYQKFMSEYIVKAQQEKYNAVKAAEAAITKKYEDKLNTFMLSGDTADPITSTVTTESTLYKERNEQVAAAAKAGKSRWGNKEVQRVAGVSVPTLTTPTTTTTSAPQPTSEVIAAADHGLRADGGVGGMTLAERITSGADAKANGVTVFNGASVPATPSSLYVMRNAKIAQAANAGKQSRWGSREVRRAVDIASNPLPPAAAAPVNGYVIEESPEVAAANHGLRADGGVGGPSLAERVNLGAQLLQ